LLETGTKMATKGLSKATRTVISNWVLKMQTWRPMPADRWVRFRVSARFSGAAALQQERRAARLRTHDGSANVDRSR
jgi:hypothetical protein